MWLLFAVGNWIDLAIQGRDHMSAVAAAILLLATGVAYVTAQRPRIIADDAGMTIRNPLRDHRIGWTGVARVDLADVLRVHYEWGQHRKVISAWAVHYSRRRQLAGETRARSAARPGGRRPSLPVRRPCRAPRPSGPRSAHRRGRSAEGRPGAPRARDRGPGRSRLGGGTAEVAPVRSPQPASHRPAKVAPAKVPPAEVRPRQGRPGTKVARAADRRGGRA